MASGYKTNDGKDLDERYAMPDDTMVTGMVVAFASGNNPPKGYLLCNGAAVSRTTYENLFNVIGVLYGSGDGSSTFNLPNLTERFIEGHTTAGMVREAGLPNITGNTGAQIEGAVSGAFKSYGSSTRREPWEGSSIAMAAIDASRSSAVYGKSSTVQPASVTMRYYIKY